MSVLVILYIVAFGALIAGAAAAIEWGLQGRIPTRHLWTVAIAAAVVIPSVSVARRSFEASTPVAAATSQAALVEVVQFGRDAGAALGSRDVGTPLHAVRARFYHALDRVEHVSALRIVELWSVASLALLAWIVTGVAHWRRERLEWEETEIDGVPVHVSDETGPAVLGIVTQRIVLPAWVRALAPEYRQLMLAHECEHIAARDPQRLALALAALVVMPWNPVLWWCAARMRRAIEMDCDARVLRRYATPREYGYLLLQVAARGTNAGPLAVPLVGLLRLPSELELRLRAMTRPRTLAGRTALAGSVLAGAAMLAAFTAPVPRIARLTSRALLGASHQIATRAQTRPRAWVQIRDTVVELDSVTIDRANDITHGVLPPAVRHRTIRDTLPSARAEDSLRVLARALAERSRQVDSMRAAMDSMTSRRKSRAETRTGAGGIRFEPKKTAPSAEEIAIATALAGRDSVHNPLLEYFASSGRQIDAALKRYYPNLASDVTANTVIWFLVDPAGNVMRTVRKEQRGVVSPVTAAEVFGNIQPDDVGMSSIREWVLGDRHLSVAWIELKK